MKRLAWTMAAALLAAGCGTSTGGGLADSEQSVFGGTATDSHPEVFWIENGGTVCSAVLVAPHVAMTAAVCVDAEETVSGSKQSCLEYTAPESMPSITVFAGQGGPERDGMQIATVIDLDVAPTGLCNNNLALLALSGPVDPGVATPRAVREELVTAGESLTVVAQGSTAESGEYAKASAMGTVSCVSNACPSPWDVGDQAQFQSTDVGVCSGDAGGPALDSNGEIAGLVIGGGCDADGPSRFVHAPRFADWIAATVASYPLPGSGGAGGTAGAAGMGAGGAAAGSGGVAGGPSAGAAGDAGTGGVGAAASEEPVELEKKDDGCSVSAAGAAGRGPLALFALLFGAAVTFRRRRS